MHGFTYVLFLQTYNLFTLLWQVKELENKLKMKEDSKEIQLLQQKVLSTFHIVHVAQLVKLRQDITHHFPSC